MFVINFLFYSYGLPIKIFEKRLHHYSPKREEVTQRRLCQQDKHLDEN